MTKGIQTGEAVTGPSTFHYSGFHNHWEPWKNYENLM